MEPQLRVELTPRMIPIDDETLAKRTDTIRRMGELGQLEPSSGQVVDTMQDGWLARINGTEFPVVTYGVEPAAEGAQALVSLLIPADAVSIGEQEAARADLPTADETRTAAWGSPGQPDPRESIPGWTPEPSLAQQIAMNAAVRA